MSSNDSYSMASNEDLESDRYKENEETTDLEADENFINPPNKAKFLNKENKTNKTKRAIIHPKYKNLPDKASQYESLYSDVETFYKPKKKEYENISNINERYKKLNSDFTFNLKLIYLLQKREQNNISLIKRLKEELNDLKFEKEQKSKKFSKLSENKRKEILRFEEKLKKSEKKFSKEIKERENEIELLENKNNELERKFNKKEREFSDISEKLNEKEKIILNYQKYIKRSDEKHIQKFNNFSEKVKQKFIFIDNKIQQIVLIKDREIKRLEIFNQRLKESKERINKEEEEEKRKFELSFELEKERKSFKRMEDELKIIMKDLESNQIGKNDISFERNKMNNNNNKTNRNNERRKNRKRSFQNLNEEIFYQFEDSNIDKRIEKLKNNFYKNEISKKDYFEEMKNLKEKTFEIDKKINCLIEKNKNDNFNNLNQFNEFSNIKYRKGKFLSPLKTSKRKNRNGNRMKKESKNFINETKSFLESVEI